MEITIKELHAYNKLVEDGIAEPIFCPLNPEHMRTLPWLTEDDKVCQKCFACGTKIYLSQKRISSIKYIINNNY